MVAAVMVVAVVVVTGLSLLAVVMAGTVVAVDASMSHGEGGGRRYCGGPCRGSKSAGSAYWALTACGTCGRMEHHV